MAAAHAFGLRGGARSRSPALRRRALALLLPFLLSSAALWAAPPKPLILAVLGDAREGGRLEAAARGATIAGEQAGVEGPLAGGVTVEMVDDGGTAAGVAAAVRRLRSLPAAAVIGLPGGDLHEAYWKAARGLRVPWFTVCGVAPDSVRNPGNVIHVGPTPVAQGITAADTALAPLAARRVAVVHEPSEYGRTLAAAFARNLSARTTLAGVRVWDDDADAASLAGLRALEAEWIYVALAGRTMRRFVGVLATSAWRPGLLVADGLRDESLLRAAGGALEGAVFLGAPDPELEGRIGERLLERAERDAQPIDAVTIRAFEAARRVLGACARAGSTRLKKVWAALDPGAPATGIFGLLAFEHHGAARSFPLRVWRVRKGRFESWPEGLLPTAGCGPPIGFGHAQAGPRNAKGKLGVLTYGTGEKRTIEADLLGIGLSTDGREPELDAFVRAEILARAIRIAHRLFRREADGTPIPGWSWGVSFTTRPPGDEVKRSATWLAVVAGDHPAAGGQAFGTWVAVYSTFLKRTMYASRKLDPPLSAADEALLDGTYRWGEDRAANFRADKIRCLLDGFAGAIGLTLSHEFGHLCGCGHDEEHPTSIMNVVAGAGAAWEDAVWIPRHQRNITTAVGIEAVPK